MQRALTENPKRIVFLPTGTYNISAPLVAKDSNGKFRNDFVLIGQNRDTTTIRIAPGAVGFNDPAAPRAAIVTASGLFVEQPYGGGKDYPGLGEGNEAFGNFVENLTVDTGTHRGAVGIDYLGSNNGAVRDVKGKLDDKAAVRKALEAARFESVRGAFRFNTNHFPVQDYYLRVVTKDAQGRVTNRTLSTVFKNHADAYVGACKMPAA